MKTTLLSALLFLCITTNAQITFEKTYGGVLTEVGKSVRQTFDGGYIIGGTNLVKTNDSGVVEWTKPYPSEYANTTSDSGYILIHNDDDIYFTKVNQIGDTVWSTSYTAGLWAREGYSIEETSDGGYIVAGRFQDFSGSGMMLLKLNALGGVSWRKAWSEPTSAGFCYGLSAHETADSGFIIAGYTYIDYYDSNKHKDVFVVKTDSLGNQQWRRNYGGNTDEFGYDIQQTTAGNYLVAGSQYDTATSRPKMYLLKLNVVGDTIWSKRYKDLSMSELKSVWQTTDGSYVVAGSSDASNPGSWTSLSVLKLDTSGTVIWDKEYGGDDFDYANEIRQTSDGGYIVTGLSDLGGPANGDMYLIKLDSLGNRSYPVSLTETTARSGIVLYPNPSNGIIYIRSAVSNASIRIFNLEGKEVWSNDIMEGENVIDSKYLTTGIYLYHLQVKQEVIKTGKLFIR